jgi:DNA-binding transcriptional LysR family regulator
MSGNDLKYMRAAIAVAEELSFSRAAKRLHLSQPTITKYISELEEMLGVILFIRDHHVVSLTDAGRAYVEEARIAVLHSDRAIQAARAAGHDTEMTLNVGRTPYADPFYTSTLVTMRLPLFPRLRLNLTSGFSCDLAHDVLTGELDAAVVIDPPESGQITSLKIDESPLFVVISRADQLARLPSLKLEDLAGRRWMMFQRSSHPPLYDLILTCAHDAKSIPSAIQHFMVPEETTPLLIDPHGIVIAPKSGALRIAREGYTMRPIEEERLIMRTLLISRADNASPALSELFRGFMRRMKQNTIHDQMSLPIPG